MEVKDRIEKYWSRREEEFSQARLALGTGAGFYAFLLKDLGCEQ